MKADLESTLRMLHTKYANNIKQFVKVEIYVNNTTLYIK